mgnify:CR=1 FL=1
MRVRGGGGVVVGEPPRNRGGEVLRVGGESEDEEGPPGRPGPGSVDPGAGAS